MLSLLKDMGEWEKLSENNLFFFEVEDDKNLFISQ